MTELEIKQSYQKLTAAQLLPYLQKCEQAVDVVAPLAWKFLDAKKKKEENEKLLKDAADHSKAGYIMLAISAAATILFFILSNGVGRFSAFICKLIAIFGVIFTVSSVVVEINYKKEIKKGKKAAPELEQNEQSAKQELEQAQKQYGDWLYIRQLICPAECAHPEYMRVFVKFVEDGRANSLSAAQNLFDEYLHRERMENMASQQVRAARAAQSAAYAAMVASQNAESAARQAKVSADNAAFHARWDD